MTRAATAIQMTVQKRVIFSLAAVTGSLVLLAGVLLAIDVYLHFRYTSVAGLNIHGYRGPLVGGKQRGARRIAVLGGSAALGYGVAWEQSFPACLERNVRAARRHSGGGQVSVVNLAANGEGAYALAYNLEAYKKLNYDLAVFYVGYNDLLEENRKVVRAESPLFRLTGYLPIFPVIFKEKAMALRYHGDLEAAYQHQPVVFKPNLAQRATADALEAAVRISEALEQRLGPLAKTPSDAEFLEAAAGCGPPWTFYCTHVFRAVTRGLDENRWVMVVTEPYQSDRHIEQQQAMVGMLQKEFRSYPRLRYVNLGLAVDLHDPALCFDGLHLTAQGNERIADRLAGPVLEVLAEMETHS